MGNSQSLNKINFEDIQYILNKGDSEYILINTLSEVDQSCLIPKTVAAVNETELLNKLLKNGNKDTKIIVYGRNCNDNKLYTKYNQLKIYTGQRNSQPRKRNWTLLNTNQLRH